jgi:hypothetical protein
MVSGTETVADSMIAVYADHQIDRKPYQPRKFDRRLGIAPPTVWLAGRMPDDPELVLECGGVRLVIKPRMLRALGDLLAAQIAVDDAMADMEEPRTVLRVVGRDGSVTHPIACEFRMAAQIDERPLPECSWSEQADKSFGCQLCGITIEPGDDRYADLARFFGGDGLSDRERKVIASVLRALAGKPRAADLERFAAALLAREPDALAIVRAAVVEVDRA